MYIIRNGSSVIKFKTVENTAMRLSVGQLSSNDRFLKQATDLIAILSKAYLADLPLISVCVPNTVVDKYNRTV